MAASNRECHTDSTEPTCRLPKSHQVPVLQIPLWCQQPQVRHPCPAVGFMVFSPPQQSPLAFLGSGWESHPECPIFPRVLTEDISQRATSWVWKSGAQNVGSDMDRVDVARSLCVFRSLLLLLFFFHL